jgi:hypothetical protein
LRKKGVFNIRARKVIAPPITQITALFEVAIILKI